MTPTVPDSSTRDSQSQLVPERRVRMESEGSDGDTASSGPDADAEYARRANDEKTKSRTTAIESSRSGLNAPSAVVA